MATGCLFSPYSVQTLIHTHPRFFLWPLHGGHDSPVLEGRPKAPRGTRVPSGLGQSSVQLSSPEIPEGTSRGRQAIKAAPCAARWCRQEGAAFLASLDAAAGRRSPLAGRLPLSMAEPAWQGLFPGEWEGEGWRGQEGSWQGQGQLLQGRRTSLFVYFLNLYAALSPEVTLVG